MLIDFSHLFFSILVDQEKAQGLTFDKHIDCINFSNLLIEECKGYTVLRSCHWWCENGEESTQYPRESISRSWWPAGYVVSCQTTWSIVYHMWKGI